jgi:anti-sigma B factor antagonist
MSPNTGEAEMSPLAGDPRCFVLSTRQAESRTIVELRGRVDVSTADELAEALSRLVVTGNVVLVDLCAVELGDSAALAALVLAQKGARRCGGELVLAGATGETLRLLELTGLDRAFQVVETVNAT